MEAERKRLSVRSVICVFGVVLLLGGLAGGPVVGQPTVGESIAGAGFTLTPTVEWDRAFLVVAGPAGYRVERVFESGASIGFEAQDEAGYALPDGMYKYELRLGTVRAQQGGAWPRPQEGPLATTFRGRFQLASGRFLLDPGEDDSAGLHGADAAAAGIMAPLAVAGALNVTGRACIGNSDCSDTHSPSDTLELVDTGTPEISFRNDLDSPNRFWEIEAGSSQLDINDKMGGSTSTVLAIEEGAPEATLHLDAEGRVGIGTSTPAAELHIFGRGSQTGADDASVLLDTLGINTFPDRRSWELEAKHESFRIRDLGSTLIGGASDPFIITSHTPSNQLALTSMGVGIGTQSPQAKLHVMGSATIEGDVSLGSSRALKQDFELVEAQTIIERLAELPIRSWKYRSDPRQATHLGPVAEEFHETFGYGADDKHLSPIDTAGVALAAAQGLARQNRELRVEVERLGRARTTDRLLMLAAVTLVIFVARSRLL